MTVETKAFNQHGEEVCYFRRKLMVWMTAVAARRAGVPTVTTSGADRVAPPSTAALRRGSARSR